MDIPQPDEIPEMFTAYYQPIVEISTGDVVGFEALTRRIAADGSAHSAGELIEKIERDPDSLSSLIRSTLNSIKEDVGPIFTRHPGFYVSVNIPPVIVGTGKIAMILEELELTPHLNRIVWELTERQVLTKTGRAALEQARQYGIRVAVDDFGTGHSGLAQIVGLDLDILKIDRSLILPMLSNRMASRLLRGVVALASVMHVRTVAEGVETGEQAFFLNAAGVDYGQGWFWSKALPATAMEDAIRNGFPRKLYAGA
jgi:sensor c-di-GMP phosphodiesterase-like protein